MTSALELINHGSNLLKEKNISTYRLDSEILLSKVLNTSRESILINLNKNIDKIVIKKYEKLIDRRTKKEPVAYILEEKEFWSKKFNVNRFTLIPRPETELMVEIIVKKFKQKKINILDIGTGSGCILISLLHELQGSRGIGIDISDKALIVAKKNVQENLKNSKLKFLKRCMNDLFYCKFDLIVSNPPYIRSNSIKNLDDDIKKYEPKIALDGGNDGLDVIKKVIYKSTEILKINGTLALEIGREQKLKVSDILQKNNFKIEKNIKDNNNNTMFNIKIIK